MAIRAAQICDPQEVGSQLGRRQPSPSNRQTNNPYETLKVIIIRLRRSI